MQTPPPQVVEYPRSNFKPSGVRFDVLSEAFQLFGKNAGIYVVGALPGTILVAIMTVVNFIIAFQNVDPAANPFAGLGLRFGLTVGISLAEIAMIGGLVNAALKQIRGESISVADCFDMRGKFFTILGSAILITLCVFSGTCLCIVPGLLMSGLFMVTIPVIVDRRAGPIEAMAASWGAIKPTMWVALTLALVVQILVSVGGTLIGLGLLVVLPVYAIVMALVYRDTILVHEETRPMPQF